MMRHSFIAAAVVVLCSLCASCTNDDDEIAVKAKGESIYLQLSLSDGKHATRTYGETIEDESQERKISNVSVFLIKQGSSLDDPTTVAGNVPSTEFLQIGGLEISPNTQQTELIEIPAEKQGRYYLYVITNTANNTAFSPIMRNENTFIGQYGNYYYPDAKQFWTANQFFMTNLQNEKDGIAAADVILEGHHPEDDPVRVDIDLERMALKVVVTEAPDIVAKPVGTLIYGTDRNYKLVSMHVDGVYLMNCATQFNLIQQWTDATLASNYQSADPKGYPELLLVSPSSNPEYPMTTGYYNRWENLVNPTSFEVIYSDFVAPGVPMYCFENNSPYYSDLSVTNSESSLAGYAKAKTKMKGRVTAVAIRVKCQLVDGGYLTEDLPIDPTEGTWTRAGGTDQTFYQYNGVFFKDLTRLLDENPSDPTLSGITTSSTVSELRLAGVKVFENGYMYYIHWIKDQNYTDNGEHYYTVMRNTYYGLEVEEINGLGDDIPGGEDYNPYDPIDVGDLSLKIAPVVRDWTIFDIDIIL